MANLDVEVFCEREHPRLVRMLRVYCGDDQLAQDIAQEALIRAVRHWPRISKLDSPGGWTYRVAVNLANSRFRRRAAGRRATQRLRQQAETSDSLPDVAGVVALRDAVAALPDRQRQAVVLQHVLGLTPAEIGEVMDCSQQAVRNLTHRARRALQSALEPTQEVDDASRS